MLTIVASAVSGLVGIAIMFLGARFLLTPQIAAAGYGVPVPPLDAGISADSSYPWLKVKGVRDVASGLFIFLLLANRVPHVLGGFMVAASLIPIGDAVIVLQSGGAHATAFGIHGVTAGVMLVTSAASLIN